MKICVIQVPNLGCMFVRFVGKLNLPDMQSMIQSVMRLDGYQNSVILQDMRNVDFDVPMEVAHQVARARPENPLHSRLALVSEGDLGFGMIRVIASIREIDQYATRACRTIPEALEWLGIPGVNQQLPAEVEEVFAEDFPPESSEREPYGITIRKVTVGTGFGEYDGHEEPRLQGFQEE
ncbi:MAG: STAS/SEC14 domain-containing protein [Pseudomonadota bacterium]